MCAAVPLGTIGAEDTAQVTEAGSTQQGITECMRGDVAVGMPGTAVSIVKGQAEQPTRPPCLDGMYVGTETDTEVHCSVGDGVQDAAARTSSRMVAAFASSVFSARASSPTRI